LRGKADLRMLGVYCINIGVRRQRGTTRLKTVKENKYKNVVMTNMKKRVYIIPLFVVFLFFSCNTDSNRNKEIRMQEIIIADNYTMKLPQSAILHKRNRWKIESSSSLITTIILSESIKASSTTSYMNDLVDRNDSQKFKLHLQSKKEFENSDFKIFINKYSGKAGSSPLASSIYFTGMILDEIEGNRRFSIELNSIGWGHTNIVDSIVGSFKKLNPLRNHFNTDN
jgi:hypothetical protein